MNYIFSRFQDKQNPDRQGYILSKNNKELETLFYDIDKISHLELVQKKKDFFNFICSKYQDVDRRTLLLIFAYEDDDMLGLTASQELVKRVKIVNDYCNKLGKQNCIYVSIHVNAAPGTGWSNATGWSVYTSVGQTKSDILATSLYESAKKFCKNKKFRTGFSDGDCDFEEHFYVLKHPYCPAVLTENFFQNCKADVEYLTSEEGKKAIVNLHVEGICNYLSKY